jgi:hypothetical protein
MDFMAIVDDVAMFAVRLWSPAPQGDDMCRALETFEPVVIETKREGAGGCNIDYRSRGSFWVLLEVVGV